MTPVKPADETRRLQRSENAGFTVAPASEERHQPRTTTGGFTTDQVAANRGGSRLVTADASGGFNLQAPASNEPAGSLEELRSQLGAEAPTQTAQQPRTERREPTPELVETRPAPEQVERDTTPQPVDAPAFSPNRAQESAARLKEILPGRRASAQDILGLVHGHTEAERDILFEAYGGRSQLMRDLRRHLSGADLIFAQAYLREGNPDGRAQTHDILYVASRGLGTGTDSLLDALQAARVPPGVSDLRSHLDGQLRDHYGKSIDWVLDELNSFIFFDSAQRRRAEMFMMAERDSAGKVPQAWIEANEMFEAIKGMGTDQTTIFDIVQRLDKTPSQLRAMKHAFSRLYPNRSGGDMIQAIIDDGISNADERAIRIAGEGLVPEDPNDPRSVGESKAAVLAYLKERFNELNGTFDYDNDILKSIAGRFFAPPGQDVPGRVSFEEFVQYIGRSDVEGLREDLLDEFSGQEQTIMRLAFAGRDINNDPEVLAYRINQELHGSTFLFWGTEGKATERLRNLSPDTISQIREQYARIYGDGALMKHMEDQFGSLYDGEGRPIEPVALAMQGIPNNPFASTGLFEGAGLSTAGRLFYAIQRDDKDAAIDTLRAASMQALVGQSPDGPNLMDSFAAHYQNVTGRELQSHVRNSLGTDASNTVDEMFRAARDNAGNAFAGWEAWANAEHARSTNWVTDMFGHEGTLLQDAIRNYVDVSRDIMTHAQWEHMSDGSVRLKLTAAQTRALADAQTRLENSVAATRSEANEIADTAASYGAMAMGVAAMFVPVPGARVLGAGLIKAGVAIGGGAAARVMIKSAVSPEPINVGAEALRGAIEGGATYLFFNGASITNVGGMAVRTAGANVVTGASDRFIGGEMYLRDDVGGVAMDLGKGALVDGGVGIVTGGTVGLIGKGTSRLWGRFRGPGAAAATPDEAAAALTPDEIAAQSTPDELVAAGTPEEVAARTTPKEVVAGATPEEVVARTTPDEVATQGDKVTAATPEEVASRTTPDEVASQGDKVSAATPEEVASRTTPDEVASQGDKVSAATPEEVASRTTPDEVASQGDKVSAATPEEVASRTTPDEVASQGDKVSAATPEEVASRTTPDEVASRTTPEEVAGKTAPEEVAGRGFQAVPDEVAPSFRQVYSELDNMLAKGQMDDFVARIHKFAKTNKRVLRTKPFQDLVNRANTQAFNAQQSLASKGAANLSPDEVAAIQLRAQNMAYVSDVASGGSRTISAFKAYWREVGDNPMQAMFDPRLSLRFIQRIPKRKIIFITGGAMVGMWGLSVVPGIIYYRIARNNQKEQIEGVLEMFPGVEAELRSTGVDPRSYLDGNKDEAGQTLVDAQNERDAARQREGQRALELLGAEDQEFIRGFVSPNDSVPANQGSTERAPQGQRTETDDEAAARRAIEERNAQIEAQRRAAGTQAFQMLGDEDQAFLRQFLPQGAAPTGGTNNNSGGFQTAPRNDGPSASSLDELRRQYNGGN